jgi:major capsid protein E
MALALNFDYILPQEVTGYARAALYDRAVNQFSLARFLPNRPIDDIDWQTEMGASGLVDAAVYRTYDAESPLGRRPGMSRLRGELPPISQKIRLGEWDRLRNRQAPQSSIVRELFNDVKRVARNIDGRLELARGDALVNGKVTIAENGVAAVVDYGRPSSHTVTASTLWTGAADPLSDLMAWSTTYNDTNGNLPAAFLTSTRVLNLMLRNQAIRNQVIPGSNQPSIVTRDNINQLLASQGLPPILTYDAKINVNKVATRVIPDNVLLMVPSPGDPNDGAGSDLGATFLGTTAESLEPEYNLEGDTPGLTVGVYKDNDPVALWTKGSAIGLPVLANPGLSLAATVA